MNSVPSIYKMIAVFTALCVECTSLSVPLARAEVIPQSAPSIKKLNPEFLKLPTKFGEVVESYSGKGSVIVIQDAHAIPDAQRNIANIIKYLQQEYGVGAVALEGASGDLDPQIFRSFPDKKLLRQVMKRYMDAGEIAGGTAAAVFDETKTQYYGVEDWAIYEEGLGLYLQSIEKESAINAQLSKLKEQLSKEKESIYPQALLEVDRKVESFYENVAQLTDLIKVLGAVRTPESGSELEAVWKEVSKAESRKSGGTSKDIEVRELTAQVEKVLKSPEAVKVFNTRKQEWMTGEISAEAFALHLKEFADQSGLNLEMSLDLLGMVRDQQTLKGLEGTKLFRDLEIYIREIKESLTRRQQTDVSISAVNFEKSAIQALDERTESLRMLTKLSKLELSREEWKKLSGRLIFETFSALGLKQDDFIFHLAFYLNAEERDQIFFDNLKAPASGLPPTVIVAGGFHAEGITSRLKEAGMGYALVMPKINHIPESLNYRAQMRGEVSWKDYFEVENGRIHLYKAFVRATRDKLLHGGQSSGLSSVPNDAVPDVQMLKAWRDQIIRDLSDQGKVDRAAWYTRYMDEVIDSTIDQRLKTTDQLMMKVDGFIRGLRGLEKANQLNSEQIAALLKSNMIAPKNSVALVPGLSSSAVNSVSLGDAGERVKAGLGNLAEAQVDKALPEAAASKTKKSFSAQELKPISKKLQRITKQGLAQELAIYEDGTFELTQQGLGDPLRAGRIFQVGRTQIALFHESREYLDVQSSMINFAPVSTDSAEGIDTFLNMDYEALTGEGVLDTLRSVTENILKLEDLADLIVIQAEAGKKSDKSSQRGRVYRQLLRRYQIPFEDIEDAVIRVSRRNLETLVTKLSARSEARVGGSELIEERSFMREVPNLRGFLLGAENERPVRFVLPEFSSPELQPIEVIRGVLGEIGSLDALRSYAQKTFDTPEEKLADEFLGGERGVKEGKNVRETFDALKTILESKGLIKFHEQSQWITAVSQTILMMALVRVQETVINLKEDVVSSEQLKQMASDLENEYNQLQAEEERAAKFNSSVGTEAEAQNRAGEKDFERLIEGVGYIWSRMLGSRLGNDPPIEYTLSPAHSPEVAIKQIHLLYELKLLREQKNGDPEADSLHINTMFPEAAKKLSTANKAIKTIMLAGAILHTTPQRAESAGGFWNWIKATTDNALRLFKERVLTEERVEYRLFDPKNPEAIRFIHLAHGALKNTVYAAARIKDSEESGISSFELALAVQMDELFNLLQQNESPDVQNLLEKNLFRYSTRDMIAPLQRLQDNQKLKSEIEVILSKIQALVTEMDESQMAPSPEHLNSFKEIKLVEGLLKEMDAAPGVVTQVREFGSDDFFRALDPSRFFSESHRPANTRGSGFFPNVANWRIPQSDFNFPELNFKIPKYELKSLKISQGRWSWLKSKLQLQLMLFLNGLGLPLMAAWRLAVFAFHPLTAAVGLLQSLWTMPVTILNWLWAELTTRTQIVFEEEGTGRRFRHQSSVDLVLREGQKNERRLGVSVNRLGKVTVRDKSGKDGFYSAQSENGQTILIEEETLPEQGSGKVIEHAKIVRNDQPGLFFGLFRPRQITLTVTPRPEADVSAVLLSQYTSRSEMRGSQRSEESDSSDTAVTDKTHRYDRSRAAISLVSKGLWALAAGWILWATGFEGMKLFLVVFGVFGALSFRNVINFLSKEPKASQAKQKNRFLILSIIAQLALSMSYYSIKFQSGDFSFSDLFKKPTPVRISSNNADRQGFENVLTSQPRENETGIQKWADFFDGYSSKRSIGGLFAEENLKSLHESGQLNDFFNALRMRPHLAERALAEMNQSQYAEFSRYFSVLNIGTRQQIFQILYNSLRRDLAVLGNGRGIKMVFFGKQVVNLEN
ncbi:MAG TPA: hypothetical protein DIS66_05280 [Candidatus Omnitrophica bacterium]|nr:hypothetical protein [Candidatus Omnitrophota bacterium]